MVSKLPLIDMARVDPQRVIRTADGQGKPVHFPARLFKFMERKWANALLLVGSFRIGTLKEYRNAEKHGGGVLDRGEGILRHTEYVRAPSDISSLSPFTPAREAAETWRPGGLSIENITFRTDHDGDGYIYCLSLSPSWENDIHPDYDTCIEITNAHAFMFGLQYPLHASGRSTGAAAFRAVVYAGRDHETITSANERRGGPPVPFGFLKPERYVRQQEYRAGFMATETVKIDPFCGENILLARCSEFHSTRPSKNK